MTITASLVVNFGSSTDVDGFLEAELDAELNSDKTTFAPIDTAFFLVYKSDNVTLSGTPAPSSGMVTGGNVVTRTIKEQLQFVSGDDELTLARVPTGAVTVIKWYGNEGQDFSVVGRSVTISGGYPAMCEVEYTTTGISYELIPPTIDIEENPEWPILVVITGEVA